MSEDTPTIPGPFATRLIAWAQEGHPTEQDAAPCDTALSISTRQESTLASILARYAGPRPPAPVDPATVPPL